MTTEKNGWFTTAAEDAELEVERRKKRALLNDIPEYVKHIEGTRYLCALLSDLLFVEANEFTIPPPKYLSNNEYQAVAYRMGTAEPTSARPPPYDAEGYVTQAYRDFQQQQGSFDRTLRQYVRTYRHSQWSERRYDRANALADLGRHNMDVLQKGLRRGLASFDVGSSL